MKLMQISYISNLKFKFIIMYRPSSLFVDSIEVISHTYIYLPLECHQYMYWRHILCDGFL